MLIERIKYAIRKLRFIPFGLFVGILTVLTSVFSPLLLLANFTKRGFNIRKKNYITQLYSFLYDRYEKIVTYSSINSQYTKCPYYAKDHCTTKELIGSIRSYGSVQEQYEAMSLKCTHPDNCLKCNRFNKIERLL